MNVPTRSSDLRTLLQKQGFVSKKQKEIKDSGKGSSWDSIAGRYAALQYFVKNYNGRETVYSDLPPRSTRVEMFLRKSPQK